MYLKRGPGNVKHERNNATDLNFCRGGFCAIHKAPALWGPKRKTEKIETRNEPEKRGLGEKIYMFENIWRKGWFLKSPTVSCARLSFGGEGGLKFIFKIPVRVFHSCVLQISSSIPPGGGGHRLFFVRHWWCWYLFLGFLSP